MYYFEQIIILHLGALTVFLLNFNTCLEISKLYQIWDMFLADFSINIGISPLQKVDLFIEEINQKMKSSLFFKALTEMLLSMLSVEPGEVERIRDFFRLKPLLPR